MSLNFGSEVMLFQALSTSTFLSLLVVLGNATPSAHGNTGVVSELLCTTPGAKGEGSPDEMSFLQFDIVSLGSDDGSSGNDLFDCGAADGSKEEVCEKEVAT